MNKRILLLSFLLMIISFSLTNCKRDAGGKKIDIETAVLGDWFLTKAYRDKKETVTLENTFFTIQEGGLMTSNFNEEMKTNNYTFALENNILRQKGDEEVTYHIYEISDSTMTLQTRYLGYDFKLIMEKRPEDSPQ
jgi:hypothetical protein